MIETDKNDRYINTDATAKMLKTAPGTLANNRFYRRGLPYIKVGGRILYDRLDIEAYLEARKVKHE